MAWRRLARQLGGPGLAAAGLTLLAAMAAAGLTNEQAGLDAQRAQLAVRRRSLQHTTPTAPASLTEERRFAASLPPDNVRQARTTALLALTQELGLRWPRSEFRYQTDRELGIAQYRVAMTLAGRYEPLRRYVAEALRRDPALALESVRLRREADGEIQAQLAWVLHMQAAR